MGLRMRNCCSWVLLLVLVYGPGFSCAGDRILARHGRQSDWWRSYQRAVPTQVSSRWGSRELYQGSNEPVLGFGASRAGAQWGLSAGRLGGMLRQQPQTASSPVRVQCGEDTMEISVKRDLYGNGKLVKPSDLSLGAQRCKPNIQSTDHMVIFQIGLQDCGNTVQIYITCYLRAAAATQVLDSMNKACSYNKATNGWSAVEGPSNICQCCQTTGTCSNPNLMTGGRSGFGRPRAFGKREALDEPHIEGGQSVTTLGPLLVTGPKQSDVALQMTREESAPVDLWVLVAVGCLSLLVVLVCAVSIGKSLK